MDKLKDISDKSVTDHNDREKLTVDIETDVSTKLKRNELEERKAYRHRFLHTACVCWSMFALGWRNALVGPTFPDLRQIIQEDLSTASWLFTAISLGGLIGSVFGGMAYDRFNKVYVFVFIMCGLGGVASAAPWCSHFIAMFIIHTLHGAFASALDTAATADVTFIWRHKAGPFMQAVHGSFSVGAIISPFVCEPFLAKKISSSGLNTSIPYKSGQAEKSFEYNSAVSETSVFGNESTALAFDSSAADLNGSEILNLKPETYGPTFIYIPYLMSTFVCLTAVSFYFILSILMGNVYEKSMILPENCGFIHERKYFLSKKLKIVFTILVALSLATYVMSERCYIGFLMTFIITKVRWSKTAGSSASSVFWIAFATGRLSGILIVKWIRLSIVILMFFSMIAAGAILLWIAVVHNLSLLVWVSIAVVGYGMSVIFASMFSWLAEHIRRLTGKMASILFIFLSTGAMLFPILEGYLMDKVSQMWFIYSLLILAVIMIVFFVFVITMFNILHNLHLKSQEHFNKPEKVRFNVTSH